MRTVVTCLLAVLVSVPVVARPTRHASKAKTHAHTRVAKPRTQPTRARTRTRAHGPVTLAARTEELQLSENLLRKLQSNLIDGGYLAGTIDGRLSHRTRRALAEFQREYHLPGTGTLDRATAEALLGHDVITTYLVAHN